MKKIQLNLAFIFYLSATMSSFICNAKTYSHEAIESLARQHLQAKYLTANDNEYKIDISEPKLDPRIQINECDLTPEVNILENQNSRNINIKISCNSPEQWQLYLPIKIEKQYPVLVANANLNKGTVLDHNNTEINYIAEYRIRGAVLSSNESILGAKLTRNLQKDAPIYENNICLVCKGDKVNIVANGQDFSIKTNGIALTDGVKDEQIEIKNSRSGKVVMATIATANKVVIKL